MEGPRRSGPPPSQPTQPPTPSGAFTPRDVPTSTTLPASGHRHPAREASSFPRLLLLSPRNAQQSPRGSGSLGRAFKAGDGSLRSARPPALDSGKATRQTLSQVAATFPRARRRGARKRCSAASPLSPLPHPPPATDCAASGPFQGNVRPAAGTLGALPQRRHGSRTLQLHSPPSTCAHGSIQGRARLATAAQVCTAQFLLSQRRRIKPLKTTRCSQCIHYKKRGGGLCGYQTIGIWTYCSIKSKVHIIWGGGGEPQPL